MNALRVMTWNIYLGADVSPVLSSEADEIEGRTRALWKMVQQTDWPSRARVMARTIADRAPDVLALQEVFTWTAVQHAPGGGAPREICVHDFLADMVAALQHAGTPYFVATLARGSRAQLPAGDGLDLRLEDHTAVLLRADTAKGLRYEHAKSGNFSARLPAKIGGEPFPVPRPWCSVDLPEVGSTGALRFINLHLEGFADPIADAQIEELSAGPLSNHGVEVPTILTGDFNLTDDKPGWKRFSELGFIDAWRAHGRGPGFTALRDEDLRGGELKTRIDWLLLRGPFEVAGLELVGDDESARTPLGLWCTDHLGIVADLKVG